MVPEQTAGTRFGDGQGLAGGDQAPNHHLLNRLVVGAVDLLVDRRADRCLSLGDEGRHFRATPTEPDVHLPGARAKAKVEPAIHQRLELPKQHVLHHRLTDAEAAKCPAMKRLLERQVFFNERQRLVVNHRTQLARWPRQHQQPSRFAAFVKRVRRHLDGQAGGGAVFVGKHHRAFWHLRLHQHRLRHGAVAPLEEALDVRGDRVVPAKRPGQHVGDHPARDVVGRRAKPAGGNDEPGTAKRGLHRLTDRLAGVRHGDLTGEGVAAVGEASAKPLLVGVEHAAKQQLGASGDEFDLHPWPANIRASRGQWQAWPSVTSSGRRWPGAPPSPACLRTCPERHR